jgi:hypothetical protein
LFSLADGEADGTGRIKLGGAVLYPRGGLSRRRLALVFPEVQGPGATTVQSDVLEVRRLEDESLWAGAGIGVQLTPSISAGASLFGTLRSGAFQLYQLELKQTAARGSPIAAELIPTRGQLQFTAVGLVLGFGAQVELGSGFRAGVSWRSPQIGITSSATLNAILRGDDGGVVTQDEAVQFHDRSPWRTTIGISWRDEDRWAVEVDLTVSGPLERYSIVSLAEAPVFRTAQRLTLQAAAGVEWFVIDEVPLRAGVFTNRSALDRCDTAQAGCDDLINPFADASDRYGGAISVGYEMERATINLGASYNFGSVVQALNEAQLLRSSIGYLFFLVGGSCRF